MGRYWSAETTFSFEYMRSQSDKRMEEMGFSRLYYTTGENAEVVLRREQDLGIDLEKLIKNSKKNGDEKLQEVLQIKAKFDSLETIWGQHREVKNRLRYCPVTKHKEMIWECKGTSIKQMNYQECLVGAIRIMEQLGFEPEKLAAIRLKMLFDIAEAEEDIVRLKQQYDKAIGSKIRLLEEKLAVMVEEEVKRVEKSLDKFNHI